MDTEMPVAAAMATIIIEPEHLSRMMVSLHPAAPTGSCHESELALMVANFNIDR
jgi:hypothetical protein